MHAQKFQALNLDHNYFITELYDPRPGSLEILTQLLNPNKVPFSDEMLYCMNELNRFYRGFNIGYDMETIVRPDRWFYNRTHHFLFRR